VNSSGNSANRTGRNSNPLFFSFQAKPPQDTSPIYFQAFFVGQHSTPRPMSCLSPGHGALVRAISH
jgi:hypothetical protein